MAISKVLYSGKSDEWTTPDDLFNKLDADKDGIIDAAEEADSIVMYDL